MKRFKNILLVVENGTSSASIERAVRLAKLNDAKLTFVEVHEKIPSWAGTIEQQSDWEKVNLALLEDHAERLANCANKYRPEMTIETKVLQGKKFLQIIRQVLQHEYDLVMKDIAPERKLRSMLYGSEDMRLIRKCPCPLFLTKRSESKSFDRIMATVDFDHPVDIKQKNVNNSLNRQILEMAISLAHSEESSLDVLHVFHISGESILYGGRSGMSRVEADNYIKTIGRNYSVELEKLLKLARSWTGAAIYDAINVKKHVLKGAPTNQIPGFAKKRNIDLVVMGTVGRTGIPGYIIGNTAETILNKLDCSVLAIKPDGFESPVQLED